ncbi:MAG: lysophospholipid acyltransferase family protein [Cyclobacteriaceae bacterium]|nr:lysophospholipid acyltransferase family protein [Cyclobacteriaceae bacterium]
MLLLRVLAKLPFSVLYLFSDFLFFISFRLIKYRREIVWSNLKGSFPTKSHEELRAIERSFYVNLCDYAVETLKLLSVSEEELSRRMSFANPEILQPYADQNQSVILMASHQFNWEWLMVSGGVNLPLKLDFIYQRVSNRSFDHLIMQCRTHFGAYPIERKQTAREVIRRKEITRAIAIVGDQFPNHEKKHWVPFLNQETAFFLGLGQLTVLTQCPAFFVRSKKIKRGYYKAEIIPLTVPPYEKGSQMVVDKYAGVTESFINEQPDNWLWSHARWKHKRERD